MKYEDFVSELAKRTMSTKKQAREFLNVFSELTIEKVLGEKEEVKIPNFGVFHLKSSRKVKSFLPNVNGKIIETRPSISFRLSGKVRKEFSK